MKEVTVLFTDGQDTVYKCETFGWDANYLFLNGVENMSPEEPHTVTIPLCNIFAWSRPDDY